MSAQAPTILIADDNPLLLQGLSRALTAGGYNVHTAESGTSMLRMLDRLETEPDLLLMDVMMPGMSGLEVLRQVHADARWPDLPVVLITAADDEALPVSVFDNGAVDFLSKPFHLAELRARVDAHVRRYRRLRSARLASESHLRAMDLVRELNEVRSTDRTLRMVVSEMASMWRVKRVSVVLEEGSGEVRIAASSESDAAMGLLLELQRYPEIAAALESNRPVLIDDVSTAPLFAEQRAAWKRANLAVPLHSAIVVPLRFPEQPRGALVVRAAGAEPRLGREVVELSERIATALVQALSRMSTVHGLLDECRRLQNLADLDELTGCANRRGIRRLLGEQLTRCTAEHKPFSVVLMDLDHFKDINDLHGHAAGDAVLRGLGEWWQAMLPFGPDARLGRYGGDEFLVVLPGVGTREATHLAREAQLSLAAALSDAPQIPQAVSASAGVASQLPGAHSDADALVALADVALYRAKRGGRDRVESVTL